MNRLIVVRHGEIEWPLDDEGNRMLYGPSVELSDIGKLQIDELAHKLKSDGIDEANIYTSPFNRAMQTSGILAKIIRANSFNITTDLRDVDLLPYVYQGYSVDMFMSATNGGNIYDSSVNPNQETLQEFVGRARRFLKENLSGVEGINIAVSHGDLISALDWALTHEGQPDNYEIMKNSRYLEKGQAIDYEIGGDFQLLEQPKLITVEGVSQSVESFRKSKE